MALLYASRGLRLVSARYGDELQIAIKSELAEIVANASKQAMKITEEFFKFRVPLDCEWKSEINWKETH